MSLRVRLSGAALALALIAALSVMVHAQGAPTVAHPLASFGHPIVAATPGQPGLDVLAWRQGFATLSSIEFRGVLPGIDMVLRGQPDAFEALIAVDHSASTDPLQLTLATASGVSLGAGGVVKGSVDGAPVRVSANFYQLRDGALTAVPGGLIIAGTRMAFWSDRSGADAPLIISLRMTVASAAPITSAAPAFGTPQLTASLHTDLNSNGVVNPGDTLRYSLTIPNIGDAPITNVVANLPLDANTTAVGGSLNVSPIAFDQVIATNEDVAAPITLTGSDADGNPLTYSIVTPPAHGVIIQASPGSASATYTPTTNFTGSDSFTVRANDGRVNSNEVATIGISVGAVNDAPSFVKGANQSVPENSPAQTVLGWAAAVSVGPTNEYGQTLSFEITGNTAPALFSVLPSVGSIGTLTYTPAPTASGIATISIRARDSGGTANGGADASAIETFTIEVRNINEAPSFTKGADQTVLEDAGAQTVAGWATGISAGVNESSQTVTFEITNNSNAALFAAGPAVNGATGALTYTPATNANGSATITLRARDDGGTTDGGVDVSPTQQFVINVTAVNDAPSFTKGADVTVLEDSGAFEGVWATAINPGAANESSQTLTFVVTNNTNTGLFLEQPDISFTGDLTFRPAANAFGVATITLHLEDNGGGTNQSATETFTITVTNINEAPSFTKGADQTVLEDAGAQTASGWATGISAGPNESSQVLTFEVTNNSNTALFLAGPSVNGTNGDLTYTPAANANGTATITLRITDDGGTANGGVNVSPTQQFVINVTAVNDAPVADDDAAGVNEGGTLTVPAPGVLDGDTDVEGSGLTAALVTGPANAASFTLNADGSFSYTHNGGETITDSFTYRANDGTDNSNTATVTITITPINDAPIAVNDGYSVAEGATLTTALPGVLGNDVDVDGGITAQLVGGPSQASSFTLNADGSFSYTHNGSETPASDSFTYRAFDGVALSNMATVTITITAANDGPVIDLDLDNSDGTTGNNFAISFSEGDPAKFLEDVTDAAITDADGTTLTELRVTLTNRLDPGFEVLDVDLTGAHADVSKTYDITTDPNQGVLIISSTSPRPIAEFVALLRKVTYSNTDPGPNPTSRIITFVGNDGVGAGPAATTTVAMTTFNNAPTAVNDSHSVNEGGTLNILVGAGVVGNDTDPDGDALSAVLVSGPTHALSFTLNPDGSFNYAHDGNGFAADSFTYRANDGIADSSNIATVTITVNSVNDPPSFSKGGDITVAEDSGLHTATGWATGIDKGGAEESGQALTFVVTNNTNPGLFGGGGLPAVNATSGTLTFTPQANAFGTATISLRLDDDGGGTNSSPIQTFVITLTSVNDAPSFTKGADRTVLEDAAGVQTTAGWATAISSGPGETDALTFNVSNNNNTLFSVQPAVAANGTLTYTLAADQNGVATVTISLTDDASTPGVPGDDLTTADQTFTITVTALNDPPSFTAGAAQTVNEDAGAQTVPAWATNISKGPANESAQVLTFQVTPNTVPGTLTFTSGPTVALDGTLTYTPAANAFGTGTFNVQLSDDGGGTNSVTHTLTITVNAVNDPPTFGGGANQTFNEDNGVTSVSNFLTSITSGPNETGQTVSFTVTGNTNNTLFSVQPAISAAGTLSFTTAANRHGVTTITFHASDNGGIANGGDDTGNDQVFTITLNPVNDPPVAVARAFSAQANILTSQQINLAADGSGDVTDGDNTDPGFTTQDFTLTSVTALSCPLCVATVTDGNLGTFTFQAAPGQTGTVLLQYVVTDNGNPTPGVPSVPGTLTGQPGVITFTVAGPVVWFVDSTAPAGGNGTWTGTNAKAFQTIAQADAVNTASDRVFVINNNGASINYAGGLTMLGSERLIGQGITGADFDTVVLGGAAPVGTETRPAINGVRPTLQGTTTLADGVTIAGVNFTPNAAIPAMSASGLATTAAITIDQVNVSGTGGGTRALSLTNVTGSGAINVSNASFTNTSDAEVFVSNGNVPITLNSTATISSNAGRSIDIQNRSGGAITFAGNLTDTGSGINVSGSFGGSVTFSGALKQLNTGANTAVSLTSNTSAAINFTGGGLDIDTTSGTGFTATGSGTITVTGANNNIDTDSAIALDLNGVTIGSGGMAFATVDKNLATGSVEGIDIDSVFTSGGGTLTIGSSTIAGTAGTAAGIDITSMAAATTFTAVSINNTGGAGLALTSNTGVVSVNAGSIGATNDPTGNVVDIDQGSANVTIAAALTKSTSGRIVEITGRTGTATVDITGSLNCSSTCTGINVQNNSGIGASTTINFSNGTKTLNTGANIAVTLDNNDTATINFTGGGLNIDTTSGIGLIAISGGTVNVSGSNNNIDTTGGTALNWNGLTSTTGVTFNNVTSTTGGAVSITSSGASDFTFNDVTSTTGTAVSITTATGDFVFHKVSANGAAKGMSVTSATGTFTVNGDSTTDGSGGTIQNATQRGAEFISSNNITLKNMNFSNNGVGGDDANCGDALGASTNSTFITGASCESNIHLQTVTTATLNNVSANDGDAHGIVGIAVSGLTLTDVEILRNGTIVGEDGVQLVNSSGTVTVNGASIFRDNASNQFEAQNGSGTASFTISNAFFGLTNFPTTGVAEAPSPGASTANSGLLISASGTANMTTSVTGSTFEENYANGYMSDTAGSATMNITLGTGLGNTFTNNGVPIEIVNAASGAMTYAISNNTITNDTVITGIFATTAITGARSGAGSLMTGTISNNTIGSSSALAVNSGCFVTACDGISLPDSATASSNAYHVTVTNNQINHVHGGITANIGGGSGSPKTSFVITGNLIANPNAATQANAILINSGTLPASTPQTCVEISSNTLNGTWSSLNLDSLRLRHRGDDVPPFSTFRIRNWNGAGGADGAMTFLETTNAINVSVPNKTGYQLVGGNLFTGGAGACPQSLSAADGEAPAGAYAESLSPSEVGPALVAARARLRESGVSAQVLAALDSISIDVTDLPGATLGEARNSAIALDTTAAGWGWFVDPTPLDDAEFGNAGATGDAAGRIDLLTTLAHEMLHVLGREDLDPALHPNDVMAGTLPRGVRRLRAANVSRAIAPAPPPIPTFTLPPGRGVTITVDATVVQPLPYGVPQVGTQASVSGDTLATVVSDDPSTGAANDPTVTSVVRLAADGTIDADADGRTDLALFRASTGEWLIRNSSTNYTTSTIDQFGLAGDIPVAGDYDGDGDLDLAVYRPSTGTWLIRQSSTSTIVSYAWGLAGDFVVPADYDGDGRTDLVVYRPSTGVWHALTSMSDYTTSVSLQWGVSGDIPLPSDYDTDGKADPAVYRPSNGTWYILTSSSGYTVNRTIQWGLSHDVPVPGDYDGDGVGDIAVYRPSLGTWFILQSTTNFTTSVSHQWGLDGDVPIPGDYDGDGTTDLVVYRPSTGIWYIAQSTTGYATSIAMQWGLDGDRPAASVRIADALADRWALVTQARASDFDGDHASDLTVYRPSTGTWLTRQSSTDYNTSVSVPWGLDGDVLVPHDYDGDRHTDVAVYRPSTSTWHILRSSSGNASSMQIAWGLSGDLPVPGEYDGDGISDLAVFRPSTGEWHVLKSSTNFTAWATYQWGLSGDSPMPGDYDGDGMTDLAVYRPASGEWFIRYSTNGYATSASVPFGLSGDIPVPGDYDGDGRTDHAVYRPSTGAWYLLQSSSSNTTFTQHQWGVTGDIPVPGDYDDDRKTDIAVWRPSTGEWFLLYSTSGFTSYDQIQWGVPGDIPVLRRP